MLHLTKKSTSFTYEKAVFVESNYAIAITKLSDRLRDLAPVFQQVRHKTKTNPSFYANSDEFIVLFAPVVIGQNYYFGVGFLTVVSNRSIRTEFKVERQQIIVVAKIITVLQLFISRMST